MLFVAPQSLLGTGIRPPASSCILQPAYSATRSNYAAKQRRIGLSQFLALSSIEAQLAIALDRIEIGGNLDT